MMNAVKSVRTYPSTLSLPSEFGRKGSAAVVRFRRVLTTVSSKPDSEEDMEDKAQNPNEKTGDVMSHSFGDGYATRSDEEGFGGIYGGNQSIPRGDEDRDVIHENHPDYDKSQGSEVKEKEKGRHQREAKE